MNRQNAATWYSFFVSFLQRALNDPAFPGHARRTEKKILKIKFENYTSSKFGPGCLLAQGALLRKYIGAFFLFKGISSKDCALLGGNTLELKMTAKINSKQTSIATVPDLYRMYATFLTPLGSIRIPLKECIHVQILDVNDQTAISIEYVYHWKLAV